MFGLLDLPKGGCFELNTDALKGTAGIWSHTSVRKDKSDMHPQMEVTAMLKTLGSYFNKPVCNFHFL